MLEPTGNGNVTMALLGQKLDVLSAQIGELTGCVRTDHDRILVLDGVVGNDSRRIDRLEGQQTARSWESRLEALIAGMIATAGVIKP